MVVGRRLGKAVLVLSTERVPPEPSASAALAVLKIRSRPVAGRPEHEGPGERLLHEKVDRLGAGIKSDR